MPDSATVSPQPLDVETIVEALESDDEARIIGICERAHPGDVEEALERLDDGEREAILHMLPSDLFTSDLINYLDAGDVDKKLQTLPETEQAEVLDAMNDDELVDLLQEVSDEQRPQLIELLPEEKQAVSEELLQFQEETAGGRMTTAMGKVHESCTVAEALTILEKQKEETEVLSRIFVVGDNDQLIGKIRLRDLAFGEKTALVGDLSDDDLTSIEVSADQEEAANMIARYDMVALPVVDVGGRLLGVITHDDAMEIFEEEATEDMEMISGIGGDRGELSYLQTSVFGHVKRRFGWVLVLAFLALASGVVMHMYEHVLRAYYVLIIYLPMVVAAGGNTGGQAATMIIRAMSLGELGPGEFTRVVFKEMRVGMILGTLLGVCVAVQIQFLLPQSVLGEGDSLIRIAAVVGISLLAQVTTSTLIGAALPLIARAAKLDPAVVASPAITTLVDVSGSIIYFALASALMASG
ncbi:MAG: magnesium transporter [Verrucomicrobiales bacterium]